MLFGSVCNWSISKRRETTKKTQIECQTSPVWEGVMRKTFLHAAARNHFEFLRLAFDFPHVPPSLGREDKTWEKTCQPTCVHQLQKLFLCFCKARNDGTIAHRWFSRPAPSSRILKMLRGRNIYPLGVCGETWSRTGLGEGESCRGGGPLTRHGLAGWCGVGFFFPLSLPPLFISTSVTSGIRYV